MIMGHQHTIQGTMYIVFWKIILLVTWTIAPMDFLSFHSECHTSVNSETLGLTAAPLGVNKTVPVQNHKTRLKKRKCKGPKYIRLLPAQQKSKVTATISPSQHLAPDYGWCHHCLPLDSLHLGEWKLTPPPWHGGYGLLPTRAAPLCASLVHSSMVDSLPPQALESNAFPNCSPACVPLKLPSEGTEGQRVMKVHFPLN